MELGASNHGGVTVRIESSDPAVALVSPDATTPGTAFIEVPVADGSYWFFYYIQGVEGATPGSVTLTASAPGFIDGTGTVNVVQPALLIYRLVTSIDTLDPDDPFQIGVGIPTAGNTSLSQWQAVRAGGSALTATITNSADTVGRLVTTAATGQDSDGGDCSRAVYLCRQCGGRRGGL